MGHSESRVNHGVDYSYVLGSFSSLFRATCTYLYHLRVGKSRAVGVGV